MVHDRIIPQQYRSNFTSSNKFQTTNKRRINISRQNSSCMGPWNGLMYYIIIPHMIFQVQQLQLFPHTETI